MRAAGTSNALHPEHRRPAAGDAGHDRRRLHRGPAGPGPRPRAAHAAARPSGGVGRAGADPPPARARGRQRRRRRLRLLPRRRLLRPRDPQPDRSPDLARRVHHRLHAVPARGEPGHAAEHLRVPDDHRRADRHGRRERVDLRRRLRARRGRADGPLGDRARPGCPVRRRQPPLPSRRRDLCGGPGPPAPDDPPRRRGERPGGGEEGRVGQDRGARGPVAELLRLPRGPGGGRGDRPRGGRPLDRGRRSRQPGCARAARRPRRGHRGGYHPAFRRPDGLRWAARGLHGRTREVRPQPARPSGGRLRRRRRQQGLPPRAPDP